MDDQPFGDVEPGAAVKHRDFNPTAGYTPHGDKQFVRMDSGKWKRIDHIRAEQERKEQTMAPTAIAERPTPAMTQWPKAQIDLVRRTVAVGATDDELALYLYDCDRRGIHPLDKLLHFTKRGGKYTPVTSIDFMRAQAAMSGEMAGSDDPIYVEADGKLVSATVVVYRMTQGQRFPYTATARWSEYCPDNAQMWRRMPHTMLGKCAEALALRKAFPQQLAGLYSSEEMDQNNGAVPQASMAVTQSLPSVATNISAESSKRLAQDVAPVATAPGSTARLVDDGPDLGTADPDDDEMPEGFDLIQDYTLDGDWHQVWWGRDGSNGYTLYKTKLAKVGLQAHNAFTERHPVRLHSKKPPFLDRVETLGMTSRQLAGTKFQHDDPAFCNQCGAPVDVCRCR